MGVTGDQSRGATRQAASAARGRSRTNSYADELYLGASTTASDDRHGEYDKPGYRHEEASYQYDDYQVGGTYYDPRAQDLDDISYPWVESDYSPSNAGQHGATRRAAGTARRRRRRRRPPRRVIVRRRIQVVVMAALFLWLLVSVGGWLFSGSKAPRHSANKAATAAFGPTPQEANTPAAPQPPPPPPASPADQGPAQCARTPAGAKHVVVSVTAQWLWACDGANVINNSPVTTANAQHKTPVGTFHVEYVSGPKSLRGCDKTGCWDDHVNVWIPFFGPSYGFHDAPWQTMPFGSPGYSVNGSHGCVHLPETEAHWVASWVSPGTAVTVEA